MNTTAVKKENINQDWHVFDAEGKVLGRLASDVASILIGKNKATYSTHINVGDKVVVLNAEKFVVTGNKVSQKSYKRYTGYPGGVKEESLKKVMETNPKKAIWKAVNGMLPKNKLRKIRMNNLYIYEGTEHPHKGQIQDNN